jgi:hypothetical protein
LRQNRPQHKSRRRALLLYSQRSVGIVDTDTPAPARSLFRHAEQWLHQRLPQRIHSRELPALLARRELHVHAGRQRPFRQHRHSLAALDDGVGQQALHEIPRLVHARRPVLPFAMVLHIADVLTIEK